MENEVESKADEFTKLVFDLAPSSKTTFDYTGSIADFKRAVMLIDGDRSKGGDKIRATRWKRKYVELCPENKRVLKEYILHLIRTGKSLRTLSRMIPVLREMAQVIEKPMDKLNRADFDKLLDYLNKRVKDKTITEGTKWKDVNIARLFFKWKAPKVDLSDIKVKVMPTRIVNSDLITDDEQRKLVEAADLPRDKAIIALLLESGLRVGELLNMRIKDVQFDQFGAKIEVNGKSGRRVVRIVNCVPLLSEYLQNHPKRSNSNYAFWYAVKTNGKNAPLGYDGITCMLKTLKKKAGITRRIHAHLWRHSAATRIGTKLNNALAKQYFGWKQSSRMLDVYFNLAGDESGDEILKLNGIIKENGAEEETIKLQRCSICKFDNDPYKNMCGKCGKPLTVEAALEAENEQLRKQAEVIKEMVLAEIRTPERDQKKAILEQEIEKRNV